MTSASAKGSKNEKLAIAILESQGWTCYRAGKVLQRYPSKKPAPPGMPPVMVLQSKQHDIFGAFDIMAMKPTEPLRFVQVSVKAAGWDKRKQVAAILPRVPMEHADTEIWLWVGGRRESGGQRFRVLRWDGMSWATCEDQCAPPAQKAKAAA